MPDRVVVDRIDFREALVFPRVVGSVVGALQPARMLLATFALLSILVVGRGYDLIRGPVVPAAGLLAGDRAAGDAALASEMARRIAREPLPADRRPSGMDGFGGRVDVEDVHAALRSYRGQLEGSDRAAVQRALDRLQPYRGKGAFDALATAIGARLDALVTAVVSLELGGVSGVFPCLADLGITIPVALWKADWFSAIFLAIVFGSMLGVFGAALCRMAALDLARKGGLSPVQALDFVSPRRLNHALVPLWPGITLLVLLPVALLLGLLGRVPGLDLIAGLAWGLALFFSLLAAVVLVPWALAMPMAIAASACEGCDGLEAAQRCGAMIYRRPLHALLYAACGVVAVALLAFTVDLITTVAIELAAGVAGISAGQGAVAKAGGARFLQADAFPSAGDMTGVSQALGTVSVGLIQLWQGLLQSLAAGAVLGGVFTVATAAYLAMRRTCDDQPFDDLWMPGHPAGSRQGSAPAA